MNLKCCAKITQKSYYEWGIVFASCLVVISRHPSSFYLYDKKVEASRFVSLIHGKKPWVNNNDPSSLHRFKVLIYSLLSSSYF